MLKIAILTNNEFVINTTKLILDQNQMNYKILYQFEQGVQLVIGETSQLKHLVSRVMMIALMDEHDDESISRNGLCSFIEYEDIEKIYYEKFNEWLDYYFDNYHYSVNENEDYFLDDVLYFYFPTINDVEVITNNKTIKYKVSSCQLFYQILPLNFIPSGTKYIINTDYILKQNDHSVVLSNNQTFTDIQIKHIEDRKDRFKLGEYETISIGDFPSIEKIKKTKKRLLLGMVILVFVFTFHLTRAKMNFFLSITILSSLMFFLYPIILPSLLQIAGNFYQLRNDGIYYFDCLSFKEKNLWIKAIEKNKTDTLMHLIPFSDIAYLRLKPRMSRSMIGGHFMHLDLKNYHLRMMIETKTSTLEFADVTMFGEALSHQINIQNTLACFINKARLNHKDIQEHEEYVYVINDPNATLSQYLNKKDKI